MVNVIGEGITQQRIVPDISTFHKKSYPGDRQGASCTPDWRSELRHDERTQHVDEMKLGGLDYPGSVAYPYLLMAASQSLADNPGRDYGSVEANRQSLHEGKPQEYRTVAPNVAYFHREPRTYMFYAVLATIFCCFPLGIPAIIYSRKAKALSRTGQMLNARRAALKSRQMIQMSVAIGMVLWFVIFLAVIIFTHPFPST